MRCDEIFHCFSNKRQRHRRRTFSNGQFSYAMQGNENRTPSYIIFTGKKTAENYSFVSVSRESCNDNVENGIKGLF